MLSPVGGDSPAGLMEVMVFYTADAPAHLVNEDDRINTNLKHTSLDLLTD